MSIGALSFAGAVSVGAIVGHVVADVSNYVGGLDKAERRTKTFAASVEGHLRSTGAAFNYLGRRMLLVGGAITGTAIAGIKFYGNFERAMRQATSVSAVTAEQFKAMSTMAEQAAVSLNMSFTETASAFYHLGQAGLSVNEQMAAFDTTVKLAKAGMMSVDQTTEILVDTVLGMGYSFKDAEHAADIMTLAVTASNATLEGFGESLSMVAAIAHDTHTPLEDVAAGIALMANVGIKGSRAGTAMRRAMVNLMDPSREMLDVMRQWGIEAYTVEGRMKPWVQIVIEMSDALQGATEEQRNHAMATIFGVRALTGQLAVFRNAGENIRQFAEQLANSEGALDRIVQRQMEALLEKIGSLGRRMGVLVNHIMAKLEPSIRGLEASLAPVIDKMTKWVDLNPELAAHLAKTTVEIGLFAVGLGSVSLALGSFAWSLSYIIPVIATFITTILPIAVLLAAIGAAAYALRVEWKQNFYGMRDTTTEVVDWIKQKLEGLITYERNWTNFIYSMNRAAVAAKNVKGYGAFSWLTDPEKQEEYWRVYKETFFQTYAKQNALWEDIQAFTQERTGKTFLEGVGAGVKAATAELGGVWSDFAVAFKTQFAEDMKGVGDFISQHLPGLMKFKEALSSLGTYLKVAPMYPAEVAGGGKGATSNRPSFPPPVDLNWWQNALQQWYEDTAKTWPRITDLMTSKFREATDSITSSMSDMFVDMAENINNIQDALVNFLDAIRQAITRAFADMMANVIMMKMIGSILPGGSVAPWGGSLGGGTPTPAPAASGSYSGDFSFASMMATSANGNVLKGGFRAFRTGGIVTKPTLGLVGEGKDNEAIVPLPDGRSIPVEMRGGAPVTIHMHINAIDTKSAYQFLMANKRAVASAAQEAIGANHPIRRGS